MSLAEYILNDLFNFDSDDDSVFRKCFTFPPLYELVNFLATDIYESDDYFKIVMDLPGIQKNDLRIESNANRIDIRFVKESKADKVKSFFHFKERSKGDLIESIDLPADADPTNAKVLLEDGTLTITIPKAEQTKKYSLKIE